MHISADVWANAPKEDEKIKTTPCIIIFVAVDGDGRPEQAPFWVPPKKIKI